MRTSSAATLLEVKLKRLRRVLEELRDEGLLIPKELEDEIRRVQWELATCSK